MPMEASETRTSNSPTLELYSYRVESDYHSSLNENPMLNPSTKSLNIVKSLNNMLTPQPTQPIQDMSNKLKNITLNSQEYVVTKIICNKVPSNHDNKSPNKISPYPQHNSTHQQLHNNVLSHH